MNLKQLFKKFWNFLWYSEGTLSYILSTLILFFLIFILVKFILFPLISLLLATKYPAVIVLTNSMNHYGKDFDFWWAEHNRYYDEFNITKEDFLNFKFKDGLAPGDLVLVKGVKAKDIKVGDVIVFEGNVNYPIIHRVVSIEKREVENKTIYVFTTKGDANPTPIVREGLNEYFVTENQIYGKAFFAIPKVGLIKIWVYKFFIKL